MQVRLFPPFQNHIQHPPVDNRKEEIYKIIEYSPLYFRERLDDIKKLLVRSRIRVNSVVAGYFFVKILFGSPRAQKIEKGLCPKAKELQQRLMAFKTNYRDLDVAQRKVGILSDLIDEIGR